MQRLQVLLIISLTCAAAAYHIRWHHVNPDMNIAQDLVTEALTVRSELHCATVASQRSSPALYCYDSGTCSLYGGNLTVVTKASDSPVVSCKTTGNLNSIYSVAYIKGTRTALI